METVLGILGIGLLVAVILGAPEKITDIIFYLWLVAGIILYIKKINKLEEKVENLEERLNNAGDGHGYNDEYNALYDDTASDMDIVADYLSKQEKKSKKSKSNKK